MPPTEVQQVLLRLNNLGAHVLRQKPSQNNFDSISDKLDDLERSLVGMDMSPRTRRTMSDSGFVDDDHFSQHTSPKVNGEHEDFTPLATDVRTKVPLAEEDEEPYLVDRDRILAEAQAVLERVSRANIDLRQRFEEMRELNDQHAYQVEESTREALNLRSENESLKSTIAFDHSELLFLKLQLKALEVQAEDEDEEETEEQRDKRVTLEDGIDQWKSDWDDVDARQRARRSKHRVTSSTPCDIVRHRDDGRDADEEGDWKLDLCKKRQGRVQSITIRRFSSSFGLDGANDEHMVEEQQEQDVPTARSSSPATSHGTTQIVEESTEQTSALADKIFMATGVQTHDLPMTEELVKDDAAVMASQGCQTESEATSTPAQQYSGIIVLYEQDFVAPTASHLSKISTIYEEVATAEDEVEQVTRADAASKKLPKIEEEDEELPQVEDERDSRKKSAWAEFMNSLTELAGMTDR
ncbi:Hypothetical protein D9617_139g092470 [Elsinoe fawcettii]|nr:Hypothetical protein D9617_139g092470 [Elsinoe fawcettii]